MLHRAADKLRRTARLKLGGLFLEHQNIQQLERQALQPLALGKDIVRRVLLLLRSEQLGADKLRVADDRCHRVFHLVREAAHEALLPRSGVLKLMDVRGELIGHDVEVRSQCAELIRRTDGLAVFEVSRGEAA